MAKINPVIISFSFSLLFAFKILSNGNAINIFFFFFHLLCWFFIRLLICECYVIKSLNEFMLVAQCSSIACLRQPLDAVAAECEKLHMMWFSRSKLFISMPIKLMKLECIFLQNIQITLWLLENLILSFKELWAIFIFQMKFP